MFQAIIAESERYQLVKLLDSAEFADTYVLKHTVDLILMDVFMRDGSNGLAAAEKIKKLKPEIKILVVTSMPEVS